MSDEKKPQLPQGLRMALARALVKGIPPEKLLEELTREVAKGDEGMPALELVDATNIPVPEGMSFEEAMAKHLEGERKIRRPATYEEVAKLNQRPEPPLKVGDRVRWREGMRNCGWPEYGEVCIVSQVCEATRNSGADEGSAAAAHLTDFAVAFFVEGGSDNGSYIDEFMFDSRRFERAVDSLEPTEESRNFLRQLFPKTPQPA